MEELKDVAMEVHKRIALPTLSFKAPSLYNTIYRNRGFLTGKPTILGFEFHNLQNTLKEQL